MLWKSGGKCFHYKPSGLKCTRDPSSNITMINNDRMLIQISAGVGADLSTVSILSLKRESQFSLCHMDTSMDVPPLVPSLI